MNDEEKKSLEEAARDAVDSSAFDLDAQLEDGEELDEELVKVVAGEIAKELETLNEEKIEELKNEYVQSAIPSKEELEEADEHMGILTLTSGELEDGTPFYAYVSIKPSKYNDFLTAEKEGTYTLNEFGTVLKFDRVKEPSEEVKKEMEEKYGASHTFEEDLAKELKKYIGEDN